MCAVEERPDVSPPESRINTEIAESTEDTEKKLLWARDVDVEGLDGGADATDDFAGPEWGAEERDPTVFEVADSAENVTFVGGLVGVDATLGKFTLDGGVRSSVGGAGADAEGFSLEAFEELEELGLARLWKYDAAASGIAIVDLSRFAKFLDAIDVAEEVDDVMLILREGGEDGGPDFGALLAANRFAIFCFDEFEADRFYAFAKGHGLDVEGKGRKF